MKRIARWALVTGVLGAGVLTLGNGRDPWLWAYVMAFGAVGLYAMLTLDEDLVRERFNPPSPGADRLSLRFVRLVALAQLVIAVADSRFGWSHVPDALRATGLLGFVACFFVIARAAHANRFFSSVVRIQSDRGHHVVDTGPYATIRHPGYAGMLPLVQFSALAMGSWFAFVAAFTYSALILRRVLFEDRYLQQNLDGYAAYAGRVPYRLIPGVW
jgi:protein-S-isoprenylcysteine O-methyltransferase Ste14